MDDDASFGYWVRRRRKALDLTQEELAQRVGCALDTIRKIESGARRPSRQVAERLADQLDVPVEMRVAFLQAARAELVADRLALPPVPAPVLSLGTSGRPKQAEPTGGLPSGTITFLCTDIVGSTQLWEQHPDAMRRALARHDTLLRETITAHDGIVFKSGGDGVYAAFPRAPDALVAAIAAQQALLAEPWEVAGPLHVRMVLHTGVAEERDGDYFGPPLNRAARLLAVGYGSQILLSRATQELVCDTLPPDVTLQDLGTHRLKDLTRPEQIFQVVAPNLPVDFPPLRTLDTRPHNLPAQLTPLIGRTAEVAAVCNRLRHPDVRLLTLTGSGGAGKTRLALQVAAELLDGFTDGVWFIDLAPITDPSLVASTIAQMLRVQETGDQPLVERLKAYLKSKQLLLVLDNFEQIVDAAPLVEELLVAASRLKVLITSRSVLRVYGEHEFVVPPLAVPDPARLPPLDRLSQYDAVRLFIERAQAVKADFTVTNTNAPAVAEICVRLDGLPLAIELAAARSKLMAPDALLARLTNRLQVLTGGARTQSARQQTLRNTIDWSYDLLDADEQRLFARLAVFVGGCTEEAVEAVCNARSYLPIDVVDAITALVNQSLLRKEEGPGGEPRFTMLETIREYALERLAESGEDEAIRQLHAKYYLALAEAAEQQLWGPKQVIWLKRLDMEYDNLRAALTWSQTTESGAEAGLRLVAAVCTFCEIRTYTSELEKWLTAALAQSKTATATMWRAKALLAAGNLAHYYRNDYTGAYTCIEESLTISQGLGDKKGSANSLSAMGYLAMTQDDYGRAMALYKDSQMIYRELGDKTGTIMVIDSLGILEMKRGDYERAIALFEEGLALKREQGHKGGIACSLINLGEAARAQGNYGRAMALYEESVPLFREVGDKYGIAAALNNLGFVAEEQGDYEQAATLQRESLAQFCEIGEKRPIASCLVGLAGVARGQGQSDQAVRLCGAVEALLESSCIHLASADQIEYDRTLAATRIHLDEVTFAAAWTEGRAMTVEQAIAEALSDEAQSTES